MKELVLTSQEFLKIKDFLQSRCGMRLEEDKEYLVKTRLFELLRETGKTFSQVLDLAIRGEQGMSQRLIHLLTTHETFWFRDSSFWNIVEKKILPEFLERIKKGQDIEIWSAGCSSGQEPYSLAILIDEFCRNKGLPSYSKGFRIWATDISSEVLEIACRGRYNSFEIQRGLSESRQKHYFSQKDSFTWQLSPEILERVHFQPLNLIEPFGDQIKKFHLIFCRNVIIYLTLESKQKVLQELLSTLHSGGYLFVGASESVEGAEKFLKKKEFEEGKYYQK